MFSCLLFGAKQLRENRCYQKTARKILENQYSQAGRSFLKSLFFFFFLNWNKPDFN